MTKDIWINLPVKDLKLAKEFYQRIGFVNNEGPGNTEVSASLLIGDKKVVVMLFIEPVFKSFTGKEIADAQKTPEVLFSIGANSRAEVDQLAQKVLEAGGTLFSAPQDNQGWMYGCGFADLDGHHWNALFMDLDKMPKA